MEIKQIINNNTIFSVDGQGNEIIVVGKGIGFHHKKGDSIDEASAEKIFTLRDENEKNQYRMLFDAIPYEVISFGIRAVDYIAECCSKSIHKRSLIVPLVDHLYTTLERYQQGIRLDNNVLWNIQFLYREEFKIAQDVTDMLVSAFDLPIDEGEANFITLHIINAELDLEPGDGYKANSIIEISVRTVEEHLDITLNRESVDFARFITHLQFFAKRMIKNTFLEEDEDELSKLLRRQYKAAYECACLIIARLEKEYATKIEEKECTYLTIHIARLLESANEI
jgi:beta-glucoside operon transcriptional antiterminator